MKKATPSLFDLVDKPAPAADDLPMPPKPVKKPKAVKPKPAPREIHLCDPAKFRYVPGILSLDVATKTGWCTCNGSGVWDFGVKTNESKGMRLIRFKAKLSEVCRAQAIKMITFEAIALYGEYPNTVGLEMAGVLKLFCEENAVEYTTYMPKQIKLFATGLGNASKEVMFSAGKILKPDMIDDNEADAVFLYHLTISDLKL